MVLGAREVKNPEIKKAAGIFSGFFVNFAK
ncbi:hypothetical protein ACI0FR_01927 [Paenochrobactrum sp. BZR 201-1]